MNSLFDYINNPRETFTMLGSLSRSLYYPKGLPVLQKSAGRSNSWQRLAFEKVHLRFDLKSPDGFLVLAIAETAKASLFVGAQYDLDELALNSDPFEDLIDSTGTRFRDRISSSEKLVKAWVHDQNGLWVSRFIPRTMKPEEVDLETASELLYDFAADVGDELVRTIDDYLDEVFAASSRSSAV